MSMRAALLGVRDRIQSALSVDGTVCEVRPSGQPIGMTGSYFIGVYSGGFTSDKPDGGYYYNEVYSVNVCVTVRLGIYAPDTFQDAYTTATTGAEDIMARVRAAIHMNEATRALCNTYITGAGVTVDGFLECLQFQSVTEEQLVGAEWFFAAKEPGGEPTPEDGVKLIGSFGKMRRIQQISSAST